MKFLRFIVNLLFFVIIFIGISVLQVGVYDVVAAQSPDVYAIHIASGNEESVDYLDGFGFWGTDIKTSYEQEPKYRVRNWFSWNWWKKGMKWADSATDITIATVKPIFVPIAQVNALKNYYGKSITDENIKAAMDKKYSEDELNNALYELYVIYNEGYGECKIIVNGVEINISEYSYDSEKLIELDAAIEKNGKEQEYARWVKNNKVLFNQTWKLKKYNCGAYDKYAKKFLTPDGHIKTAVITLYYQQFVSLILALVFIVKYPINLFQARIEAKRRKPEKE